MSEEKKKPGTPQDGNPPDGRTGYLFSLDGSMMSFHQSPADIAAANAPRPGDLVPSRAYQGSQLYTPAERSTMGESPEDAKKGDEIVASIKGLFAKLDLTQRPSEEKPPESFANSNPFKTKIWDTVNPELDVPSKGRGRK